MILRETLEAVGPEPVLIEAGVEHAAASLLSSADALADAIRTGGHRRALVRSHSAVDILVMLLATGSSKCDLFIAHAALPDTLVERIVAEQGITAILDRPGGGLRLLSGVEAASNGDERRIFLMTSGTTGQPKIAGHTLQSLVGRITMTSTSSAARWLLTFPPTSFAGLQVLLTSVIGRGVLVVPEDRSPAGFATAASQNGITHISGTPTFWRSLLLALGSDDALPPLRHITLGGETADQATLDRLASKFPAARIVHIYASTELGALFHVQDRREGFPVSWLEQGIDGIGLRISSGVLEVRSPRRMLGYASAHADPTTADGWISTGDLVRVEADRVRFVGRADVTINVGGYKVSAEEVEAALMQVEGVAEACVVGVPNPITGRTLVAELVCAPQADEEQVRAQAIRHAKAKLEPYKVPRIVRIVSEISVAESGKKSRKV